MDMKLRKHCQSRKAAMLLERALYESDWLQVADYVDPYAGRYLRKRQAIGAQRLPSRSKVINNTATLACRTMDAGFMGGHTSKSRPWFLLTAGDARLKELPEVKAWCDDVTQIVRDILAGSNFYTALPHFYHLRHLFGVGALACDDDDQDIVRFYSRNIGTYAVALDHRGICDSFWYEFEMRARQIVQAFGDENLPTPVRDAISNGREDMPFMVQSLIEPNPDAREGMQPDTRRPFRQVYWVDGAPSDQHGCLDVQGHYANPVKVSRWDATGSDVYGVSPGLDSLGDIKQLQYLEGEKLRLIDLLAKPPLALPDSMRNRQASLEPGSKTYVTPSQTAQAVGAIYTPDARGLQQVMAEIEQVKGRIERAFFADLFRMLDFLDDRQRTAYEISERKEEKVAMLGPALESLTDEVLAPIIEDVYGKAERRGQIPEPPEALNGVPLKLEFTSTLAMAQKAAGLGTIERIVGFVGGLVQMTGGQRMDILDKLDLDQAIDEFHDRNGSPSRMVRGDEQVAQIRQQAAQQAQMQQIAQMAPALKQGAEAVKTMGEAVPQDGSALEAMV